MIEDAELIASFLDGELHESERRQVLERLDRDDAFREIFLEAAQYQLDTKASNDSRAIVPLPTREDPPPRWLPLASIAAALVILATTGVMMFRVATFNSAKVGRILVTETLDLSEQWYEHGWTRNRGVSATSGSSEVLFRVGVRALDLEIALRAGALEDAILLTQLLDRLLENLEFSAVLRYSYTELGQQLEAGVSAQTGLELAATAERLATEQFAETSHLFTFGQCAEAGRLAAQHRSSKLLRSRFFRRKLSEIERFSWNDEVEMQLDTILDQLGDVDEALDFETLSAAFQAIIDEG